MLSLRSIAAHEKHAGVGMGWSAPMGSDVFVYVFQPMPDQDLIDPPSNEFGILSSERFCLNDLRHARERA
ncbi:hypothetical protein KW404_16105 [Xanthomonas vasicola pv. vasculorum]|nr:hypothetical protein [Xanthomonas vasicola pv. vasculorum]